MKRFIFRKNLHGFDDWIASINEMRRILTSYKKTNMVDEDEYKEANLWYTNYLEYMRGLIENQKEYIRIRESHHIPPNLSLTKNDCKYMYERWLEVVASFRLNQLEEITNKEVGAAIKAARKFRCMNRAQLSGVLGIGQDTLKCYEEGRRTIPFDVYYKLMQIFDLDIGILISSF